MEGTNPTEGRNADKLSNSSLFTVRMHEGLAIRTINVCLDSRKDSYSGCRVTNISLTVGSNRRKEGEFTLDLLLTAFLNLSTVMTLRNCFLDNCLELMGVIEALFSRCSSLVVMKKSVSLESRWWRWKADFQCKREIWSNIARSDMKVLLDTDGQLIDADCSGGADGAEGTAPP